MKVRPKNWHFLQDIGPHTRNPGEEKEGENAGCGAEEACCLRESCSAPEAYAVEVGLDLVVRAEL